MRGIAIAPLLLLATLGCSEDPVPGLEEERRQILAETVEKQSFWSEVERKGELLKEVRQLRTEAIEATRKIAEGTPELMALEDALASSREINERAAALLFEARRELGRLEQERTSRETAMASFRERSRSDPLPPAAARFDR